MALPRDYDAELKALQDRQRALKIKQVRQLGELVIATDAAVLDLNTLTGALLAVAAETDLIVREGWRAEGEAFFLGRGRAARRGLKGHGKSPPKADAGAQSDGGTSSAS